MASRPSEKLLGGAAAIGVEVLLVLFLLFGLSVRFVPPADDPLRVIDVATAPPPPKPAVVEHRARQAARRRTGRAGAPNLKAHPTDIVAPPVVRAPPPPVIVAPVAGEGAAARSGAAPTPGVGTGAAGSGNGPGAGGAGNGDGGGGDGDGVGPRLLKGRIDDSDYPRELWSAGIGGTVGVRYHVEADGRATGCSVTRSSGNAELDSFTCSLIEKRFRFAPAEDENGRPVRSTIVENHSWIIDDSARARGRPD